MHFNMDAAPGEVLRDGPQVGDVYKKDGGPLGFMVVVAVRGDMAYYLGIDGKGEVVNAGQGNSYYFGRRRQVGRVDLPLINIEWDI